MVLVQVISGKVGGNGWCLAVRLVFNKLIFPPEIVTVDGCPIGLKLLQPDKVKVLVLSKLIKAEPTAGVDHC